MHYAIYNFASAYGAGNYNSSQYSTGTTTGTSGSAGSSGVLANTGFDLVLGATIACVIIFAALVIKFWKKRGKKSENSVQQ